MHKLMELKEKLMRELEDYSENGKFSRDDVETIKYITSAIDHICNIMDDDDYSAAGPYNGMYNGGSYTRRSYARGRMNAPRDSRGRYSGAADVMADLQDVMNEAPDDRTRQEIQNLITRLGRM